MKKILITLTILLYPYFIIAMELENSMSNEIKQYNILKKKLSNSNQTNIRFCNSQTILLKDEKEKYDYHGAYAHLWNAYKYEENAFKNFDITTGIVHREGINFHETSSKSFMHYINSPRHGEYEFQIENKNTDPAKKKELIKKKIEELYTDINRRIFDIFTAAFTLAQTNNKSELHIQIPYVGIGNDLQGIQDTPIEPLIIGCYYSSFIHNFEYFFINKQNYKVDNFKITFLDDDNTDNIMNQNLSNEVSRYIKQKKPNVSIAEAFKNNFITSQQTLPKQTLLKQSNNQKILILVHSKSDLLNRKDQTEDDLIIPADSEYPKIYFPQSLPQIDTSSLPKEDSNEFYMPPDIQTTPSINIDQYINIMKTNFKDSIVSMFMPEQDKYNNTITIENNTITLPNLTAFISGEVTAENNQEDRFKGKNQPSLKICIEYKRFQDILITALNKLMTENTDEVTIDIDAFLMKIKNQSLENCIEKLIQKSILNIIQDKKLNTKKILFKYSKFYYNIINCELIPYNTEPIFTRENKIKLLKNIKKKQKHSKNLKKIS